MNCFSKLHVVYFIVRVSLNLVLVFLVIRLIVFAAVYCIMFIGLSMIARFVFFGSRFANSSTFHVNNFRVGLHYWCLQEMFF